MVRRVAALTGLVLLYLLLIAAATHPLIHLIISGEDALLVGECGHADMTGTLWFHWWVDHALSNGLGLFNSDYLSFPQGEDLWIASGNVLTLLIFNPVIRLFGLFPGYNITVLSIVMLNCLAGYLLTAEVARSKSIAFFGGLLLGLNHVLFLEIEAGRLEQLAIFWVLLFFWSMLKMRHGKTVKYVLLSAVLFTLTALGSWHYGILVALAAGLWALVALAQKDRRLARLYLLSLLAGLALILPAVILQMKAFASAYGHSLSAISDSLFFPSLLRVMREHSVDLLQFFLPPQWRLKVFLGVPFWAATACIILAVVARLAWGRRAPQGGTFWILLWLSAAVFSLGPVLQIHQESTGLHLPFYYFIKYVPYMGRFLWPHRFLVLFLVASVVLIATTARVLTQDSPRRAAAVSTVLAGLVATQLLLCRSKEVLPLRTSKVKVHDVYARLARLPAGALLELPIHGTLPYNNTEILAQITHQKKLFNGIMVTPYYLAPKRAKAFISTFSYRNGEGFFKNAQQILALKQAGLKYVVFREQKALGRGGLTRGTVDRMLQKLRALLGEPEVFGGRDRAYLFTLR